MTMIMMSMTCVIMIMMMSYYYDDDAKLLYHYEHDELLYQWVKETWIRFKWRQHGADPKYY
jgi:hypothetical protein